MVDVPTGPEVCWDTMLRRPPTLDTSLRRSTRRQLRELRVRTPLSVLDICARLGESRGTEIVLKAVPFEVPGPFGLWVSTRTRDCILYQSETSPQHQNHIVRHEIGHILAGHGSDGPDDAVQWVEPEGPAPGRPLHRDLYGQRLEREAEVVAAILTDWTLVMDHVVPPSTEDPAIELVRDALDDRRRWT